MTSPNVCRIFLSMLCCLMVLSTYGQTDPDTDPESARAPADSILSIRNLSSQKDTIRNKDVIAVTLQTTADLDTLKTLYIGGLVVPGAAPWKVNAADKIVYFYNDNAVQAFLLKFVGSNPFDKSYIPVSLGIGSAKRQVSASVATIYIEVRQKINYWWVIAVAIMIAALVIVALRHNILKDDQNLYYSLGRAQLFFWTLLLMVAYLQICLKTDTLPDIPLSVLAIIGISVTTTAASKFIENKTKANPIIDRQARSEGFMLDILSDGSSINIQRFQNVAFNVFFGAIFLQKAFSTHLLPDFDQNVLILLGVSSGAYAGLKMTEAAKEQVTEPVPTNADLADNTPTEPTTTNLP